MQRLSKNLALSIAALTLLFPTRGVADDLAGFGGDHAFSSLHTLDSSSEKINIHPFSGHPSYGRAWSGFHSGALSFGEAMRRVVAAKTGAVEVEVRVSAEGGGSQDVRFYVGNVPICGYHVRAQEVAGRKALALGNAPRLKSVVPTSMGEWPDRDVAYDVAKAQVQSSIDNFAGATKLGSSSRCYVVQDQTLLPAWKMQVVADGLPYEVLTDDRRAFQVDRAFFDVDGTAKVYPLNKVLSSTLTDIPLPGLDAGGGLQSEFLKTVVPSGYTAANEPSHAFAYGESDPKFAEASTFAHASLQLAFFEKLGFVYYDTVKPLELRLHVAPGGRHNNALFTPAYDAHGPNITIDDGDGIDLQNLALDSDVVSHELGHLIIFKYVKHTSGEALVLHEGLADFFAFARSGDACLGESICPAGGQACVEEAHCLRSAEIPLVYQDQTWNEWAGPNNRLGHLHGQLISGMLWDLRKAKSVPEDVLTALVFKAISYLPEDPTFENYLGALLTADKEVTSGTFEKFIRAAAAARGLSALVPGDVPAVPDPAPPAPGTDTVKDTTNPVQDPVAPAPAPAPAAAGSANAEKNDKKSTNPCAVVGTSDQAAKAAPWTLLLFALPAGLLLVRPRRKGL